MKNKQELQNQIEVMKQKLAEMGVLLNEPEASINYWQPTKMDRYFYLHHTNQIHTALNHYEEDIKYRVLKTQKEAEDYAKYVKAEETLRRVIAEGNAGWLPNWNSSDEYKFEVQLSMRDARLYIDCFSAIKRQPNFMYIKSKELAEKLMKEYEAEFKTYLSY